MFFPLLKGDSIIHAENKDCEIINQGIVYLIKIAILYSHSKSLY